MIDVAWILAGLVALWAGSEFALRGTIVVADRRGLSQGFLGVTVLAIGTDLPELLVAVTGGIHQLRGVEASGVVVGNAVGSALTQGSLVLGLAGLFGHLHMSRHTLRRDGRALLAALVLLGLLCYSGQVTRLEGLVLLGVYGLYTWQLTVDERGVESEVQSSWRDLRKHLVAIAMGLAVVLVAAELVVEHALVLATKRGWDQTVIGVFLVGAGTSLPELALSLGAIVKGRGALAVGNVIGSNVFDLLVPVGVSAVLHPLTIDARTFTIDLPALALLTLLGLFFFARERGLQRWEAFGLLVGFGAYAWVRLALGGVAG